MPLAPRGGEEKVAEALRENAITEEDTSIDEAVAVAVQDAHQRR